MKVKKVLLLAAATPFLVGCANTVSKPVSISEDTYMMTAKGKPSPFGVASAVDMGGLLEAGSKFCQDQGKQFVLLERDLNQGHTLKLGDGSITFRCDD